MNRSIQVEGAFGVLKQDYGFRRFLTRGVENVKVEMLLLCFSFNINKLHNPYDNALAENFFSVLKTECIYRTNLKTYGDARLLIDEYIYFYNNQRFN